MPDGTKLEILKLFPDKTASNGKPPLVMLHGAGHAAWCYKETFMPYFADRGYDTYAVSFRSQGKSDTQSNIKSAGTLGSHAADLDHVVSSLERPPVILAHSFGGLVAQRYVVGHGETAPAASARQLAGLALLASTPPSGNSKLVGRTLRRKPLFSIRLTWGFITRSYSRSMPLFKDMFLSQDIPEQQLQQWFKLLQDNMSPVQLCDLSYMTKHELPIQKPPDGFNTPVLSLVGDQDFVVDVEAADETAQHFGEDKAVALKDAAHDLMLDTGWPQAADAILDWLSTLK